MSSVAHLLALATSEYEISRRMGQIAGGLILVVIAIWGVKKLGVFRDKR